MTVRSVLLCAIVFLTFTPARHASAAAAPAAPAAPVKGMRPPNVILIITDDMGYGDLACHGNPVVRTPNLDRLHAQSVRFTDFHVSPTCAPTRAALLTGRHEFRGGVTHTIHERERLSLTATTYAQVLKSAGYATGIFGKWHLGDEDAYQPDKRGFDEVFVHGAGGIGQTYPGSGGDAPGNTYFDPAIRHNGCFVRTRGYCTDVFFDQAMRWIRDKQGGVPFYCHIATNTPHAPLDCPPEYEQPYAGTVDAKAAAFYGMITNIDDNVGRLMAKLKALGIERDTVVIFMTDNGGTAGTRVYNAGMRAQKGTPFEGGTRVPLFVHWPGTLAGGADVDALTAHVDLFPTIADLARAEIPEATAAKLEGRSLVPLLTDPAKGAAAWPDRLLFTHVGRWERGQAAGAKHANCAVRDARYNLVSVPKIKQGWQLFDRKADPGEKRDLAAAHPDVVARLEAGYDAWWESVQPDLVNEDAVGPAVNPFKAHYWKQFGGGPSGEPGRQKGAKRS